MSIQPFLCPRDAFPEGKCRTRGRRSLRHARGGFPNKAYLQQPFFKIWVLSGSTTSKSELGAAPSRGCEAGRAGRCCGCGCEAGRRPLLGDRSPVVPLELHFPRVQRVRSWPRPCSGRSQNGVSGKETLLLEGRAKCLGSQRQGTVFDLGITVLISFNTDKKKGNFYLQYITNKNNSSYFMMPFNL